MSPHRLPPPYDQYHTPEGFDAALAELAETRAGLVAVETLGPSAGGRELKLVRIGADPSLPAVLIVSLVHGCDWVSAEIGLRTLRRLLDQAHGGERAALEVLNSRRIVWIPVLNPDGRERVWRRIQAGKPAPLARGNGSGVDLDRNFPVGFDAPTPAPLARSRLPITPWFRGPAPFSEPESRALRAAAINHSPLAAAAVLHSIGNLICYPYKCRILPAERSGRLRKAAARLARRTRNPRLRVGQAWFPAPLGGSIMDWLWGHRRVTVLDIHPALWRPGLDEPLRLMDPFVHMNPPDADSTAANLYPAMTTLFELPLHRRKAWL